ncbi:MAG: hypothetical protein ABH808_01525 [Candidatus Kuenenbacteria bacterium]
MPEKILSKNNDFIPFKENLQEFEEGEFEEGRETLKESPKFPNKFFREYPLGNLCLLEQFRPPYIYNDVKICNLNYNLENGIAFMKRVENVFENLVEFGLNIPKIDLVVGKNIKNKDSIFMLVDKIYGERMVDIKELSPKMILELDNSFASYAIHLNKIFQNGGL